MCSSFAQILLLVLFGITFALLVGSTRSGYDDERIVGGQNTTIDRFPHQISLRLLGRHFCGGSIYKLNVVITAAHCVYSIWTVENLSVLAGTSFRSGTGGVERQVQAVHVHPGYASKPTRNDVAILILAKPLYYSDLIQPISLPNAGETIRAGTKAVVSGWGALVESGGSPDQLQYVPVHIITNEECAEKYDEGEILPSMICAGDDGGGRDACQGDSGGPLTIGNVLVGIVSWGNGCARPEYPGVYTRVAYVRDWIDSELTNFDY